MDYFKKIAEECAGRVKEKNEFFGQKIISREVEWNKEQQKLRQVRRDSGGALRVHKRNKIGFVRAGQERLSPAYLTDQAEKSLKFIGEEPATGFCELTAGKPRKKYKDPTIEGDVEHRLERIKNIIASHLKENEHQSLQVSYSENLNAKEIYREGEQKTAESRTGFNFSAWAVLGGDDSVQSGFSRRSFTEFDELDFDSVLAESTDRARRLLGAEPPEENHDRLILTAPAACTLLGFIGRMLNGTAIVRGRSPFQPERIGEKIGADNVSIVDNPRRKIGSANRFYDDEGGKIEKLKLFDSGVYKNFFTNYFAAQKSGFENNHRSFRSYRNRPSVGRTNFYLQPGDFGTGQLREKLSNGPVVTSLQPGSGFNSTAGNFSVGAKGYMIEAGKYKRPFCSATLSGEMDIFLANIVGVGDQLPPGRATVSPGLLVENVTLGGS